MDCSGLSLIIEFRSYDRSTGNTLVKNLYSNYVVGRILAMKSAIKDIIKQHKIVPVIALEGMDQILPLADALIEGRLPLIEITFRTKIAAKAIAVLTKQRPELLVGAGTVLTTDELKSAVDSGASFGVAPGFNPAIVEEALRLNFPFIPGILTPTELEAAMELGIEVFKFFPAEAAGGINYLTSLAAPYSHKKIEFVPTGGVNPKNLIDYLAIKAVMAVGGTWIAKKDSIEAGQWEVIKKNCREAVKLVGKLR